MKQKNKLVPTDPKGEKLNMSDDDIEKAARVASKRTHTLGLEAAIGNITFKEALQAAYIQGINDHVLAINSRLDDLEATQNAVLNPCLAGEVAQLENEIDTLKTQVKYLMSSESVSCESYEGSR